MTDPTPATPSGKPSPVLVIFLIFPLVGLLAAAGFMLTNSSSTNVPPTPLPVTLAVQPTPTSLISRAAPNFELPGLDGKTYRLSSYRGKVVFLNFWATWCDPCRREMPAFQEFLAGEGAQYAVILGVNNQEPPGDIRAFLTEYQISGLPILLDDQLAVYNAYGVDKLPTTLVIDGTGMVRFMHLGEMTMDDLTGYVAEIACRGSWPCNKTAG